MIVKRVLILANSRKLSGRCIAGREISGGRQGPWVRPVSSREHQEVSEYEREDGRDPVVLDVVDIPLLEHRPAGYQQENWLLDEEHCWVRNRQATSRELEGLVDESGALWVDGYSTSNGSNDRVPIAIATATTLNSSLRLIQVRTVTLSVFAAWGSKRRIQARFTHRGAQYGIRVTDPRLERDYLARPDGDYQLGPCFLTVSLGEEYHGYAYKLVAAIIPVG